MTTLLSHVHKMRLTEIPTNILIDIMFDASLSCHVMIQYLKDCRVPNTVIRLLMQYRNNPACEELQVLCG